MFYKNIAMWILILGVYRISRHPPDSSPRVPGPPIKVCRHTGFASQSAELVPTSPTQAQRAELVELLLPSHPDLTGLCGRP